MGNTTIHALRHAAPYLRLYRGKLFVIKAGGEAFSKPGGAEALLEQIGVLHSLGIQCVLVHGGGAQSDELAEKLGVTFEKVDGRRVTSPEMTNVMVHSLNGGAQGELLSAARRLGLDAVGLNGMDAGLVLAERRPPTVSLSGQTVDYGQVGEIKEVRTDCVTACLERGFVPMISPLSGDAGGQWLNINADTVAAELAIALGAEKVVFMTGAPGVLRDVNDPNSLLSELSLAELRQMEESGELQGGMLPKAAAIARCLEGGVERVHVVSFAMPDALLVEVFTNEGSGTLLRL